VAGPAGLAAVPTLRGDTRGTIAVTAAGPQTSHGARWVGGQKVAHVATGPVVSGRTGRLGGPTMTVVSGRTGRLGGPTMTVVSGRTGRLGGPTMSAAPTARTGLADPVVLPCGPTEGGPAAERASPLVTRGPATAHEGSARAPKSSAWTSRTASTPRS
jgi:hypothetical protein